MIERDFINGNGATAYGALRAGLNAFFGYPITPSSEIPETLAKEIGNPKFPEFKAFLQAASELEAVNMAIGASSAGAKAMMATSGLGFSLKQEGLSFAAQLELPLLVVDVNRSGPGLGSLGPEQSDYFQATKGGGHGGYRNIVLAPNSVQEMATFPSIGFSLAFKYRNPVVILTDAFLGQLKEDIVFPEISPENFDTPWATTGAKNEERHLLLSFNLEFDVQSKHLEHLENKYRDIDRAEPRAELYLVDDAKVILVAYGIVSRICKQVVDALRAKGIRAGLFRPITLSPFPADLLNGLSNFEERRFLVVELNMGQMYYDVKLSVRYPAMVDFMRKFGGQLPSSTEVTQRVMLNNA